MLTHSRSTIHSGGPRRPGLVVVSAALFGGSTVATQIQIIEGPDKGKVFPIQRRPVTIGLGVNADIRLADAELQGYLQVEWRNGTYIVTNQLQIPIWLDNSKLAQGQSRAWYDDAVLMPTRRTQLILKSFISVNGDTSVQAVDPSGQSQNKTSGFVLFVASCGIFLGSFALMAPTYSVVTRRKFHRQLIPDVMEKLESNTDWAKRNGLQIEWDQLKTQFQVARVLDSQSNTKSALERYKSSAELLNKIRSAIQEEAAITEDPSLKAANDAIEAAAAAINDRLTDKNK